MEKLGGEVRVELEFHFETSDVFGTGTLFYDMRLYEGTSEDTTDQDGRSEGDSFFTGNDDGPDIGVVSEERGSADWASAKFRIENTCHLLN